LTKPDTKAATKPDATKPDTKGRDQARRDEEGEARKAPLPRGLLSNRLAFAGAFVSGLLYWISFAGMDVWPLTFVAYVPLWIALQKQPRSARSGSVRSPARR